VLYEMLTGNVPFTGDAPVEIAMKHLTAIPEPPSKLNSNVPHISMRSSCVRLRRSPTSVRSAEEMDADLRAWLVASLSSPKTETR